MIPQKTCAGLYIVLNRSDIKAEPECMRCRGNKQGCQFCAVRAKERGGERMKITFLPQNITCEAEAGDTILQAAVKAGVNMRRELCG